MELVIVWCLGILIIVLFVHNSKKNGGIPPTEEEKQRVSGKELNEFLNSNVHDVKNKHSHYFKSVDGLDRIDVYRVLQLYNVTDPCFQHAVKKLLVAGGRGAGKDVSKDIQEAIDTLQRWQEMQNESNQPKGEQDGKK